jgi:large subunit ribosomal protein L19
MDLMQLFTEKYKKPEPPVVNVGDTVRVHIKVKEGNRERIQVYEGTVIAKKHGGIEESITVRRISYGVGVEKVFPIHSPTIESIETVRRGAVRRAKIYYLRAGGQAPSSRKNSKQKHVKKSAQGFFFWYACSFHQQYCV